MDLMDMYNDERPRLPFMLWLVRSARVGGLQVAEVLSTSSSSSKRGYAPPRCIIKLPEAHPGRRADPCVMHCSGDAAAALQDADRRLPGRQAAIPVWADRQRQLQRDG